MEDGMVEDLVGNLGPSPHRVAVELIIQLPFSDKEGCFLYTYVDG